MRARVLAALVAAMLAVLVACKGNSPAPSPTAATPPTATTPPSSPTPTTPPMPTTASSQKPGASPAVTVRVDRRIELLSILHRLIGHQAYTSAPATPYVQAVDKTFGPFANHPAVAATRALRASHAITWDAPMILAVHLDDQLQLVNAEELPALDARFTGADLASYAQTLRDFARDTKLDEFLATHKNYATSVETVLQKLIEQEKPVAWFDAFFGAKAGARYIVVPALLKGTNNNGVRATLPDGTLESYQVLGIHAADGLPTTDDAAVALLVHEMAHAYINPLIEQHRAALEPAGTKLFALVAEPMKQQAYNSWKTFVDESVVRAVVVLYLLDRKSKAVANAEAHQQLRLAFRWTPDLAKLFITRYQADRKTYADFAAFMPEVIKTFDAFAAASATPAPTE